MPLGRKRSSGRQTTPLIVSFAAGEFGAWRIDRIAPVIGEGLADAPRLDVIEGAHAAQRPPFMWTLRGATSDTRYITRAELDQLVARQEGLGRTSATRAALIPIRKIEAWWAMARDERRAVFEEESRHIAIGLRYLPGIARRLHHSREFGEDFDFLTGSNTPPKMARHSSSLFKVAEQLLNGGSSIARSILPDGSDFTTTRARIRPWATGRR
jgi:hypothetical protein